MIGRRGLITGISLLTAKCALPPGPQSQGADVGQPQFPTGAPSVPTTGPTISSLPPQLVDIKLKVQAARKSARFKVDGVTSFYDQVLKTAVLDVRPNSSLVFENISLPWIALYADTLDLNGRFVVTRGSVMLDGDPGANGRDGASVIIGPGSGGNGGPGTPGREGRSQRVPEVFIFTQEVLWNGARANPSDVDINLIFDGHPGGRGGDGGRGGNGGNGGQGEASRDGWLDCSSGPGWGGRGGNAGTGGVPGIGGDGSDGSRISIFVQPGFVPVMEKTKFSVARGRAGPNGRPGAPGIPGLGGPEGRTGGHCGPAGRKGQDGMTPAPCGLLDITGRWGSDAAPPVVSGYTGFGELQSFSGARSRQS